MKLQFLNIIPLDVISGGNIYNKTIIEGLRRQDIEVDYNIEPLYKDYDITIVDSLFMTHTSEHSFKNFKTIIALIHQIPKLDNSTLNFYRTNAKFIVTGEQTKEELISDWQMNGEYISVIRPGLPSYWKSKTTFRHKPKHIILIANFVQEKGFEMLIRILEDLGRNELQFHIIGSDTLHSTYAETIIKAIQKTRANVQFHFNIGRGEVYNLLLESDIFLSLSKSETFGMAIFEALSMGIPCVTYKTGDIRYFRQYSNYIMIEDYSENAFIEVIEELVNNSKTYKAYCSTAPQNQREWHQVINEFSTHLKTMV